VTAGEDCAFYLVNNTSTRLDLFNGEHEITLSCAVEGAVFADSQQTFVCMGVLSVHVTGLAYQVSNWSGSAGSHQLGVLVGADISGIAELCSVSLAADK
jgi:hypothetical protein